MKLPQILTSIACFLALTAAASAQPNPDVLWTRVDGDGRSGCAYSVRQTTDGGYVIAGSIRALSNLLYPYVIKTDADEGTVWTQGYQTTCEAEIHDIQQTSDGGYILVGNTELTSPGDTCTNVCLIKTNSQGDTMWTRLYTGIGGGYANSVQQTSDGGYVVSGYPKDGYYRSTFYVMKTDSLGDTLWTRNYGRTQIDTAFEIQKTSDGGFVIAGTTGPFEDSLGHCKMFVVKTNGEGDILWTHEYGDDTVSTVAYSIQQTIDGGYVIAGNIRHNDLEGYFVKTDAHGDVVWATSCSKLYVPYSIRQTTNGGYVVVGYPHQQYPQQTFLLLRLDGQGDTLWTRTYIPAPGRRACAYSVQQTTDGGYVLSGYTTEGDFTRYFVVKTGPDASNVSLGPVTTPPTDFNLKQNSPNPFNPTTQIGLTLSKTQHVRLEVFNLAGQKVKTLADREFQAGERSFTFDGSRLASGIYFYALTTGDGFRQSKKMMLIR